MNIKTKFDCGDTVWLISRNMSKRFEKCKVCDGTGYIVVVKTNIELSCPTCRGQGGQNVCGGMEWQVTTPKTIGQVSVMYRAAVGNSNRRDDNISLQEEQREEMYMCHETGIGTGCQYAVTEVFATSDEAQTECDRRNAAERKLIGMLNG